MVLYRVKAVVKGEKTDRKTITSRGFKRSADPCRERGKGKSEREVS